jgi:hypothetical protein
VEEAHIVSNRDVPCRAFDEFTSFLGQGWTDNPSSWAVV